PYKTRRDRAGSELWPRRINKQKKRNNNESTDSIQKKPNPGTSHRTGADRARDVCTRAGTCNAQLRSYNQQRFVPWTTCRHCARRSLSFWLAELDMSGRPDLGAHHEDPGRFRRLHNATHVRPGDAHWVAYPSGPEPYHGRSWGTYRVRG